MVLLACVLELEVAEGISTSMVIAYGLWCAALFDGGLNTWRVPAMVPVLSTGYRYTAVHTYSST